MAADPSSGEVSGEIAGDHGEPNAERSHSPPAATTTAAATHHRSVLARRRRGGRGRRVRTDAAPVRLQALHGAVLGDGEAEPSLVARVAVSVTIAETRKVALYLARLKRSGRLGSGAVGALSDCVECFDEALRLLGGALGELRRLRRRSFGWQTSKVQTWVSAALTDGRLPGRLHWSRRRPAGCAAAGRVRKVTYLASNALAFVNNLASSGGGK
ncbi:unnamed protein product [Spirodela intermedia]|uniref:Pectinesterase inhibitor domain-containing protein n=1 Tax=Spirodela intermedia TaxID=51605 RepID=A0A7I8IBQ8_SPIIN|nr:unnamed protein product [Spirodela intermedia]CAA6654301.1 unnamed protein product [Spirodela intermedia]